ncbi:SusD/RagB family nutrient-binding outer membrane lipoprotein [Pontibacter sp. E15-1]|uniref:SusD/RagB family nutrient-binding outer membrane lipoprotein n=1 Tax=Pontibacter sp. E15-1 TaxID=2919918 RepID=UPI001F4FFE76|nr:SusD/RagB family nutrient-binding outer membrane lipoprotein [Pontibacter sp. E15-1]MCJ8165229.1 SusD/RagB family nutrient-binding outer membrane lipoprotein [Pontibacter sp. E15-1]
MKKIYRYISIFSLALSVMGCESFVEGFEEDPNNPSGNSVDVNNMIQGVMLADGLIHEGEMSRITGMWTDQFSGVDRQYVNLDQYIVTAGDFDSPWSNIYYATITQARIAKGKARNEINPKIVGVAQVLEAHAAGTTTALFGDIPFSEVGSTETPSFDSQAQVYSSIQVLLDSAITNLALNRGLLKAEKDIYFGGDAQKWLRVAYTLKARYYLQAGDYAKAESAALQGISDPANNMVVPHFESYYNANVFYSFGVLERPGYMTAEGAFAPKLIDPAQKDVFARNRNNAKTNETARFNFYYKSTSGAYDLNYTGAFAKNQGFALVTYGETQLILAEARSRQDNLQGAVDALNAYRSKLNDKFGAGAYQSFLLTDFAIGGFENNGSLLPKESLLNEILEERYVTFIGNIEAFNDVRRTDNRLNIPVKGSGNQIPERFLYPQDEVNSNPNTPSPLPGLFEPTALNK